MSSHLLIQPTERVPYRGAHYVHAEAYDKVCADLIAHHDENARLVRESHETARICADRLERLQSRLAEAEGRTIGGEPAATVSWWKRLFRRTRR